jgi:histidinol-phosphate aminotransferase
MKIMRASGDEGKTYTAGMSEDELRRKYAIDEIIKIGSNENPIGPSPLAVEAIRNSIDAVHRYPPMTDEVLRNALAGTDTRITSDMIVTGNGACDVLTMIADTFLNDSAECIICRPTFPIYEFSAKRNGAHVVYADLHATDFTYDINSILKAITNRTQLIFLCSPNNPTGSTIDAEDLKRIVAAAPPDSLVVFDEVYHHFVDDKQKLDPIELVQNGRRIIVVHSFSKAYGLAGCRLGYGIANPETIRMISGRRLPFHLNNPTIEAALAALGDTDHLSKTIATVLTGRVWLQQELSKLGVETWPSAANFILFRTPLDSGLLYDDLLRRGVIVRPLENFYLPKYLRVTVGNVDDNKKFIAALKDTLEESRSVRNPT